MTAAKRECWEELGFVPEVLHGPIGRHHTAFAFNGRWLIQDSAFFWARVTRFEPAPQELTPLEERFILGWRWWSPAELQTSDERIYPADLAELLATLPDDEGPPAARPG